jgi:hypothetical protein
LLSLHRHRGGLSVHRIAELCCWSEVLVHRLLLLPVMKKPAVTGPSEVIRFEKRPAFDRRFIR